MPILNMKISGQRHDETVDAIAGLLLDLTTNVLGKKRDLTAITFQFIDAQDWMIAGTPLSKLRRPSFYLDIKITDETNTKDEKARYMREVFAGMRAILGDVREESYIYIEDVRAAAYGYGGKTQEHRYHQCA
ncbi:MAG: tautomerase family protein [Janthinobacterium lividum]